MEKEIFKVRIAVTYAAYFFIEAKDQDEAEAIAEDFVKNPDTDMVAESSHAHHTIEVEETGESRISIRKMRTKGKRK